MVQPVANPDVWAEILQYFRISFAGDNEDDIHYKRRIILSVALICSQLVNVGLNELWRTMTTLEPAARLFGGAFRFKEEKQYWVSRDTARYGLYILELLCRTLMLPRARSIATLCGYNHICAVFGTYTSRAFLTTGSGPYGGICPFQQRHPSYAQT